MTKHKNRTKRALYNNTQNLISTERVHPPKKQPKVPEEEIDNPQNTQQELPFLTQ